MGPRFLTSSFVLAHQVACAATCERRPLGASIAPLMGRRAASHAPRPPRRAAARDSGRCIGSKRGSRAPSPASALHIHPFRLSIPFFARRALVAAHHFSSRPDAHIRQIIIHWLRTPSPEHRVFSLPSDPLRLLKVPASHSPAFVAFEPASSIGSPPCDPLRRTASQQPPVGTVLCPRYITAKADASARISRRFLRIPWPDTSRRNTANMSHGKMTLYKLVVLGDGGVGKTALTIQVGSARAALTGHEMEG